MRGTLRSIGITVVVGCTCACSNGVDSEPLGPTAAMSAVCVDEPSDDDHDRLRCGIDQRSACVRPNDNLFVISAQDLGRASCGDVRLALSHTPLLTGDVLVEAYAESDRGRMRVCTATVSVETSTTGARQVTLWPPNHRMVEIDAFACAGLNRHCGDGQSARFTEVLVDEPENATGDGNTTPDVDLQCGRLRLRAERRGNGDGRVYRVGVEVESADGTLSAETCDVLVPPNAARAAVFSGEVRRHVADDSPRCEDAGNCGVPENVNRGPVPEGCIKIEASKLGREPVVLTVGSNTATLSGWRYGEPSGIIGFDVTVTSAPALIVIKAGPDEFALKVEGELMQTWTSPERRGRPRAVSSIVFCSLDGCDDDASDSDDDDDSPDGL